jgi:hypothetical protein
LGISNKFYSLKTLWLLFSVCAFPIHVWTFILVFRDFSWISERTNSWDAFGVGAYGLLIALIESCFILVCVLILSLILPKNLTVVKKVTTMGILIILVALWAIVGQLYFLVDIKLPNALIEAIANKPHPLWIIYGGLFPIVSATVMLPVYSNLKSEKLGNGLWNFFERLTTLTSLYLFLDICSLIVVIIRNV